MSRRHRRRGRSQVRGAALALPRYWPSWAAVALLYGTAQLPLSWQRALGRGLGTLLYALVAERRHIARVNLRICMPDRSEAERERIVRAHFRLLGESVFEMPFAWWGSARRLRRLGRVVGASTWTRRGRAGAA